MTDLQRRQALFAEFASKFPHRKVGSLVAVVSARDHLGPLRDAVDQYLSGGDLQQRTTPNGIVVPNRDTGLEFNALARRFYRIMDFLPRDHVPSWNVPLNLRVKWNDGRTHGGGKSPRATERRHCDAWVHEDPHNVIMQLFVCGAGPHNCVRYWEPPEDFREEWLEPRNFDAGQEIAGRYAPLDYVPRDGDAVLTDISVIHCTHQLLGGGGRRVSIDTTFGLERVGLFPPREHRGIRVGWDVVTGLGQTHLLVFPNTADEHVDTEGGKRQAVNCNVRKLC